jgi:hypothetical protein
MILLFIFGYFGFHPIYKVNNLRKTANAFETHYQPVVVLLDGKVAGIVLGKL